MLSKKRLKTLFTQTLFLFASSCCNSTNMQTISRSQLANQLKPFGYKSDFVSTYWQDRRGTTVYVPDGNLTSGFSIFLLRSASKPLRIKLPRDNPIRTYWIDSSGVIHYLPRFAYPEFDRTIGTFIDKESGVFAQVTKDKVIHVGQVDHAQGWLFSIQQTADFTVNQICARGEVVYLLDHQNHADPMFSFSRTNCWAFKPDPADQGIYVKIDEFSVPGIVRIVDPFAARFVCDGYGYMPFPGHPFLYDIQSHKVCKSLSSNDVVLFLDKTVSIEGH